MATQIKLRRDSYQNWYDNNPVLGQGEPGYDLTNKKLKIGDGVTLWRALPYFDDQQTDLSAYAGHIIPSDDNTYDLGSPAKRWRDAFIADNSVYIGDLKLSNDNGKLLVQKVTDAGLQTEEPVPNTPSVVSTDRLTSKSEFGQEFNLILSSDGDLNLPYNSYINSNIIPEVGSKIPNIPHWDDVTGNTRIWFNAPQSLLDLGQDLVGWNINRIGTQDLGSITSVSIDGSELSLTISYLPSGATGDKYNFLSPNYSIKQESDVVISAGDNPLWKFTPAGTLKLPQGRTFEFLNTPLTNGTSDDLARVSFSLSTDGVIAQWMAATPDPKGTGYVVGDEFYFDEIFLGIPGASVTISVTEVGAGGTIEGIGFTAPPLYPADIYRDSPINLQVGSNNRWTFDANGNLTVPGSITSKTGVVVSSDVGVTSSGIYLDGDATESGNAILFATNDAIVRADNNGTIKDWLFGSDGNLTVPGSITRTDRLTLNSGGANSGYTAAVLADGELGKVLLRTDDGTTTRTWEFDKDGNLKLPTGGDITDSAGNSVLGGGGNTVDQNIWVQTFEQTNPITDIPMLVTSVEYDADGNIIALFYNGTEGGNIYTSVGKYTSTGARIWTMRFADNFNTNGWGLAIGDNSVYVTGFSGPDTGPNPAANLSMLVKLSLVDGTIVWSKTYDFGISSTSGVVDVGADGNPVIVGFASDPGSNHDYITTSKINATTGAVEWTKKLNGQRDEEAYGMAVGADGSTVVVGYMDQLGGGSTNAVATAVAVPSSNPNWTTQYAGGTGYGQVTGNGVEFDLIVTDGVPAITIIGDTVGNRTVGETIITLAGEYFGGTTGVDDMTINVASITATGDQDDRMVVVKYDNAGDIVWQKAVQFDAGFDCSGADADIDDFGNIYVVGQYRVDLNPGTKSAMSIVKFNSSGVKQWSRRVVGGCDTFGTSIVVGPDNKLYVSGVTQTADQSDYIWVVAKYSFDGLVEWQRLIDNTTTWSFGGPLFFNQGGGSNIAVKNGYVALAGGFGDPGTGPRAALVQVAATGDTFTVGNWDFTTATFSGNLFSDASDITVVDAQLTDSDNASNVTVATITPEFDSSAFLIGTVIRANADNNELVNGNYAFRLNDDGTISLPTLTTPNSTGNTLTTGTLALGNRNNNVVITQQPYDSVNTGSYNIEIRGQRGYGTWSTPGNGGYGSGIEIHGGQGGETSDNLATGAVGGEGGYINIRGGNGQAGKKGGYLELRAGDAQYSIGSSNDVNGGNVTLTAGSANESIEANKGYGGNVFINAGQGNKVGQHGDVIINTDNSTWAFTQDGRLGMPNGYALSSAQNTYINAGSAPTVAYTSLDGWIGGIKATIKVSVIQANNIDGDHDEDVQMCEMIISTKRRFIDNGGIWIKTAVASVYGVTHTSDAPLATFTVNYVENYVAQPGAQPRDVVQILAEPTAAMTGTNMWVMVTATELTND
jgi:hypothetical protein